MTDREVFDRLQAELAKERDENLMLRARLISAITSAALEASNPGHHERFGAGAGMVIEAINRALREE